MFSYKKAELKSFLQFHREGEEPLRDDEVSRSSCSMGFILIFIARLLSSTVSFR